MVTIVTAISIFIVDNMLHLLTSGTTGWFHFTTVEHRHRFTRFRCSNVLPPSGFPPSTTLLLPIIQPSYLTHISGGAQWYIGCHECCVTLLSRVDTTGHPNKGTCHLLPRTLCRELTHNENPVRMFLFSTQPSVLLPVAIQQYVADIITQGGPTSCLWQHQTPTHPQIT